MNLMPELFDQPFAQRVGWTLVHSIWQGAIMAALFALLRPALRRRSAQARYVAACFILLALAIAVLATLAGGFGGMPIASAGGSPPGGDTVVPGASPRGISAPAVRFSGPTFLLVSQTGAALESSLPWLVAAWLTGVAVFGGRRLRGMWWVRRIRLLQTEALDAEWLGRLNDLKLRFAVSRPVRLLKSTLVEVPLVVGWLRPVILVPATCFTGLTPAQLEAIVAHELAHVCRHDYLVNAFQIAMETLIFYHPAVWWISRCIREEREHCCDELVLRACEDRVTYARALLKLEELRVGPQFAFAATGGSLLRRIRLLLGVAPAPQPVSAREFSGLALLGLGCVFVVTGIALMLGPVSYLATARLRVERDHPDGLSASQAGRAGADDDPYFLQTEFEVVRSPVVLKPAIVSLRLADSWGRKGGTGGPLPVAETVARLRAALSVRPVRNTALFELQARDDDPAEAASIANAVAGAYRNYRSEQRGKASSTALKALEARWTEQERKVREAQKKVDDLRASLRIPAATGFSDGPAGENAPPFTLSAETVRRIESLRIESQAELVREQTLLNQLKSLPLAQLAQALPATGVQDPLLLSLSEQLNLAEQKLVALKKEYGPAHPECLKVASQVEDLNQKIKERAAGFLTGKETKVAALKQSLQELNARFDEARQRDLELAKQSQPYWAAKRDLEELERFRQVLFVKLASERIDMTLPRSPNVELVDEAVAPAQPVAPNQPRAAALLATGMLLGLLGVFMIKASHKPVLTPAAA